MKTPNFNRKKNLVLGYIPPPLFFTPLGPIIVHGVEFQGLAKKRSNEYGSVEDICLIYSIVGRVADPVLGF